MLLGASGGSSIGLGTPIVRTFRSGSSAQIAAEPHPFVTAMWFPSGSCSMNISGQRPLIGTKNIR